jgi:hypothetical protein
MAKHPTGRCDSLPMDLFDSDMEPGHTSPEQRALHGAVRVSPIKAGPELTCRNARLGLLGLQVVSDTRLVRGALCHLHFTIQLTLEMPVSQRAHVARCVYAYAQGGFVISLHFNAPTDAFLAVVAQYLKAERHAI